MPAKNTQMPKPSPQHPPVGTLIDGGALELVEVLGVGGYGVVYRAIDALSHSPRPQSYAVKCLTHDKSSFRQRLAHIREIALHQIASAHPNVVTLHRVVEEEDFTYIVMDYATDGDLFSQILHNARYQGDDYIIKQVFLQLLDAVEYCHTLGVYHRDLKPENILCFDDGMRIAITDFGLATSDRMSTDFRTGSIYHMSPECHDEDFARRFSADPNRPMYSPMANDIWSLAVVLLNLTTGRNPWRSASISDPTFQAYLRDPEHFIPSVLPISPELNSVLVRMLAIDWQKRLSMDELREAIEDVDSFYSDGVIFDGSMAKCPWEADVDIEEDSTMKESSSGEAFSQSEEPKSRWSVDSTSDIVFASRTTVASDMPSDVWRRREQSSANATWAHVPTMSNIADPINMEASTQYGLQTPATSRSPASSFDSNHPMPSLPSTPSDFNITFERAKLRKQFLTIDTNAYHQLPKYYNAGYSTGDDSSMMHTAIEHPPYDSSYYLPSTVSHEMDYAESLRFAPTSATTDEHMTSPYNWDLIEAANSSKPSVYSMPRSCFDSQNMSCDDPTTVSIQDSVYWPPLRSQPIPIPAPREPQSQPHHHATFSPMTDITSFSSRPDGPAPKPSGATDNKRFKSTNLFNPIKLFPRPTSPASPPPFTIPSYVGHERHASDPTPPMATYETTSTYDVEGWCAFASPRKQTQLPLSSREGDCRREAWLRPRRWFSPGRLFSGAGAS